MAQYAIWSLDVARGEDGIVHATTKGMDVHTVSDDDPMPKTAEQVPGCTPDLLQALLDGRIVGDKPVTIVGRAGAGGAWLVDWSHLTMNQRALRGIIKWARHHAPRLFDDDGKPVPHMALNTNRRDLEAPRMPGTDDTASGVTEEEDIFASAISEMAEMVLFVKNGAIYEPVRIVLPNDLRSYQERLDKEMLDAIVKVWHLRPAFVHEVKAEPYDLHGTALIDGRPGFLPTEPELGALDALYNFRLIIPDHLAGKLVCQDTEGMEVGGKWSHLNRSRHINVPTFDSCGRPCVVRIQIGINGLVKTDKPVIVYPENFAVEYTNKAHQVLDALLTHSDQSVYEPAFVELERGTLSANIGGEKVELSSTRIAKLYADVLAYVARTTGIIDGVPNRSFADCGTYAGWRMKSLTVSPREVRVWGATHRVNDDYGRSDVTSRDQHYTYGGREDDKYQWMVAEAWRMVLAELENHGYRFKPREQ